MGDILGLSPLGCLIAQKLLAVSVSGLPVAISMPKDGMDQAKWALPRSRHGVAGADIAKYEKPRLKLQCCWTHSIGLHFFLVDPRVQSDSSLILECGARALEHMQQKARQLGRPAPKQLAIVAASSAVECPD